MAPSHTHIVPGHTDQQRLQEYGVGLFAAIPTKSALKKALKRKEVRVNGKVASTATIITGGETITFSPQVTDPGPKTLNLKLEVLFQDEHLAAVVKPAGILVSGNRHKTVANALPQNLKKSSEADAAVPQPAHRLDFATTGILLAGKTATSIRLLNKLFEHNEVDKTYYAVTIGPMGSSGTINTPVEGKQAITHYEKIATVESPRFRHLNLLKLTPETGRRHQIRIHLAGLGNPVLGDRDYSPQTLMLKGKGMYLHAFSVTFVHPVTGEAFNLTAPLPGRFTKIFGGIVPMAR